MEYQDRIARVKAMFPREVAGSIGLRKSTSNLFRDRNVRDRTALDLSELTHVLSVDREEGWIEAEGLASFEQLTAAALAGNMLPAVVPQLKSITVGGAVAGVGIEASSFRYGLVHETVLEMDILTGEGLIVFCTPENECRDLFFGFANSYGALGYATRVRLKTVPAKPYVALKHRRYRNANDYFSDLARICDTNVDFVDGVIFEPDDLFITTGQLVDRAPYLSDYTYKRIYYQSIRGREADFLTVSDFIWRWDTDWFWCSKNLFLQNPLIRRLAGPRNLNSANYGKIMRWNSRWGLSRHLDQLRGLHAESVIQDVDIPIENAVEFLRFFQKEIGIKPIWICPIRPVEPGNEFVLYPMRPERQYVNFGFWEVVRTRHRPASGHLNRLIERTVTELGGIKSLYSDAYYSREEFAQCYGGAEYEKLKAKYDPHKRFAGMYEKCVGRH